MTLIHENADTLAGAGISIPFACALAQEPREKACAYQLKPPPTPTVLSEPDTEAPTEMLARLSWNARW